MANMVLILSSLNRNRKTAASTAWDTVLSGSGADSGYSPPRRQGQLAAGSFFAHKPNDYSGSTMPKTRTKNRRKTAKNKRFSVRMG